MGRNKNSFPNQRQPKAGFDPALRHPKSKEDPGTTDTQTPGWQFHKCDFDHPGWGWGQLKPPDWVQLIQGHLKSFETMTWAEIRNQSGGRTHGTNHHPCSVCNFSKDAQDRLTELRLEDTDDLFSLRLNGTHRLYGIKDGRVLRFVWQDPHHGSENGAYPVRKK
jgi:hypothetical protein